jgi:selenium metabolism protein yedF
MKIDCRDLVCPEPVIRTKNALQSLKVGESLEILVNAIAPRENITRFLNSQKIEFSSELDGNETKFVVVKNSQNISEVDFDEFICEITPKSKKVIYLNEQKAGSGEVGVSLLSKFLGAFLQVENKPEYIICVNEAVRMTANRSHVSFPILKQLESAGVKILSCGSCLEAYKLVADLAVGEITNAYEIVQILSTHEQIKL